MCGNFQVGNYIQPLWETIAPVGEAGEGSIYNGAVEAITTLTGAALSFALGFLRLNWTLLGEPTLAALSAAAGAVLIAMASAADIWLAYAGYVLFRALYQALITVASFEVARNVADTSYGLVFGVNTFAALLFQTLLTLAVADGSVGLSLQPRAQFVAYGIFWLAIGALFLTIFCASAACGQGGLAGYASRARSQGFWVSAEQHCPDSERREAPLGTIDPQ